MNNDSTLRLELKNIHFQDLHYSHCTSGRQDKEKSLCALVLSFCFLNRWIFTNRSHQMLPRYINISWKCTTSRRCVHALGKSKLNKAFTLNSRHMLITSQSTQSLSSLRAEITANYTNKICWIPCFSDTLYA